MYGKTHTVRCIHFMQNNGPDGEMMRLDRDTGIWTILVNSPDSIEAIEFMSAGARPQGRAAERGRDGLLVFPAATR